MLVEVMGAPLTGELTTKHSASSYGQPVLVVGGVAYGTGDVGLHGLRLVSATEEERRALAEAGYHLPEAE